MHQPTLNQLPNELLLRIFSMLTHVDLISNVSRQICNKCLWKDVDLATCSLTLKRTRRLERTNLIGTHTSSLRLTFDPDLSAIEKSLNLILKRCPTLRNLEIARGQIQNWDSFIKTLPQSLVYLSLAKVALKSGYTDIYASNETKRFHLESLSFTDCSWIHDSHLISLLKSEAPSRLQNLNVSGCYRLFYGPPSGCNLEVRLTKAVELLTQYCPEIRSLNLAGVFTLPLKPQEYSTVSLNLFESFGLGLRFLELLNLSQNETLAQFYTNLADDKAHYKLTDAIRLFLRNWFSQSISRSKFILDLCDWPLEIVETIIQTTDFALPDHSQLTLIVNNKELGIDLLTCFRKCKVLLR